jgi:hypothetical protein
MAQSKVKVQKLKKPLLSEEKVVPYSDMEDFQLIVEGVDFKLCKKNMFRIGRGAETLHVRLPGQYTKEKLESYGRSAYHALRNGPKGQPSA